MTNCSPRSATSSESEATLRRLAAERILVLDGAMGTMIQALSLDEEGYRGARFDAWNREVRGNNDLLNLTRPDAIRAIHLAYFRAGADIVSTNTFSSTRVAQSDYAMAEIAYELNLEGARLAKEAADFAQAEDGRARFVAGAIGPTNRTASISPDVANPGFRSITFDELRLRLRRTDPRPDRRRRRCAADRDHLRHAQRQGRDLRRRRSHGSVRHPRAGDDLGHHHRPLRAAPLRADARSILEFGRPRRAAVDRAQLRARRARDARPCRRARPRRRYADLRLSQCRPAQRIRPLRRRPGGHGDADRRIRRCRPCQHCRRLLRHHARSHPRHRRSRRRQEAAPDTERRAAVAAVRARALHADAGDSRS